jgi:hypothetical protein
MFHVVVSGLALFVAVVSGSLSSASHHGSVLSARDNVVPLMNVVQLTPTIKLPEYNDCPQATLMEHTFAFSYGKPFVGKCLIN